LRLSALFWRWLRRLSVRRRCRSSTPAPQSRCSRVRRRRPPRFTGTAVIIGILTGIGIPGIIGIRIAIGTITVIGEHHAPTLPAMMEIKPARLVGRYVYDGLTMGSAMKASINKTWLEIGIVTVAILLASSAATSPVVAASTDATWSRPVSRAEFDTRRHIRRSKHGPSAAAIPRYYGRPTDYAPAYPPGPVVLFTPFFD
jgi:hypothetical protein